jgi:LysM repeat protein
MHKVASGETLASIARRYGMAGGTIAAANGLKQDSPMTGDRLLIPVSYRGTSVPKTAAAAHPTKGPRKHLAVVTHTASNRVSRGAGE